jgi:hypothetical protein
VLFCRCYLRCFPLLRDNSAICGQVIDFYE